MHTILSPASMNRLFTSQLDRGHGWGKELLCSIWLTHSSSFRKTLQQSCRSSKAEPNFIFTWNRLSYSSSFLTSFSFNGSPFVFHGFEFVWREVWEAVKIILWQLRAGSDESVWWEPPAPPPLLSLFYPFGGKAVVLNLVLSRFHTDLQPDRHSFSVSISKENPEIKNLLYCFQNPCITKSPKQRGGHINIVSRVCRLVLYYNVTADMWPANWLLLRWKGSDISIRDYKLSLNIRVDIYKP
jgi:hypothetical protein